MDIALKKSAEMNIFEKLKTITDLCRISNLEEILSNSFEGLPNQSPIDYVGELNKNDIMH